MDQQPNNAQIIAQQKIQQQQEDSLALPNKFFLPGQLMRIKQQQKTNYNASTFSPTPQGLVALYAGIPSLVKKTNSISLIRFPVQYMPVTNDLVIGTIKVRTAQTFIVDIGAPLDSILGALQFDGVTKRNKPNLKVGAVVFCQVVQYSKYTGGKLSCINKGVSAKKHNELGQLKDGYVFWIPQYKHQEIQNNLLQKLGKCAKFQVAFGKNGRIWLNSSKLQNTMVISNIFKLAANNYDQNKINAMISLLQ